MAEAIKMPLMSDTMTEGVIVDLKVNVGDKIKSGDVIADVETDKATMELESYSEGTILYLAVEKGKAVPVDGLVAIIGKEGEDYKSLLNDSSSSEKKAPKEEKTEGKKEANQPESTSKNTANASKVAVPNGVKLIRMPLMSDTMKEGKIVSWNKKVGDKVKSDDALAEVETDKATMEVVGYEEGTLLYITTEAGNAAKINDVIALVGPEGTDVSAYADYLKATNNTGESASDAEQKQPEATEKHSSHTSSSQNKPEEQSTSNEEGKRIKASPLAKRLAQEKGYDIAQISGSGDGGRIVKKDVDEYKPGKSETPQKGTAEKVAPFAVAGQESYEDIPNSQMRKTIARRLAESKYQAPHFYLTMEINMDNAMQSRKALNELSPVKISFNDLVIKASAMALRKHPAVNSSWMGDFIRQNNHIHIGSAVAVPEGLIVPVIRFADQKSLSQIASDAKELYEKAKNKKLQPEEFSGNTFTISNLGMMDIEEFTAIINPPDSAILAVGKIKEVVVKKGEGFGVSNFMKVTLSCDHRSVDGAVGAAFLQTLKAYLENPVTMLV